MTGYGNATAENERLIIKAEFKAVNSKFMELFTRLPKFMQDKEFVLRNEYGKLLERGTVTLSLSCELKNNAMAGQAINTALAGTYYRQLTDLATQLNLNQGDLLPVLMNMPDVISSHETELTEDDWAFIHETIQRAFALFNEFRNVEGKSIHAAFVHNVKEIERHIETVESLEPERVEQTRTRLQQGVQQLLNGDQIDMNRMEQEIIYYIEKIDIAEEKTRLRQHCKFFRETMDQVSSGKKLGFIAQEMGREINTMGAKANHFGIQQAVVFMKEELEKIKEQTFNIV